MRGSYGVAKERGYELFPAPVAQPVVVFYCNLYDLVKPTLKNIRKIDK